MRFLVTGCAGFIGSHVTEALLAAGPRGGRRRLLQRQLRPATRSWRTSTRHATSRPSSSCRSTSRAATSPTSSRGADAVVHLAAEPGVRRSWGDRFDAYVRNNVMATHQLLRRHRIARRGPRWSTRPRRRSTARPRPSRPARTRSRARSRPTASRSSPPSTSATCTTPTTGSGPSRLRLLLGLRAAPAARHGLRPLHPRGARAARRSGSSATASRRRDFTFVGDVVAAVLAAAAAEGVEGRVYNIGGGSQVSVNEALGHIARAAGPAARGRATRRRRPAT